MIFIGCSLALLVIYAGTQLLIRVKLESLTRLYRYIAWFLIVMGFLLVASIGASAAFRCCMKASHMMEMGRHSKKMHKMHGDACCMGEGNAMMHHASMNCQAGGMCGPGSGMSCHMGQMECHQGSMKECCDGMKTGGKDCMDEGEEDCAMMKGMHHGKDTTRK